MLKLNLGCGRKYLEGYINVDSALNLKKDLELDLETSRFPYEDNTVDEIRAYDLLEHIKNLRHLLNECWRVLKPLGIFDIAVPDVLSAPHHAFSNPTHVRFFTADTFKYFYDYAELGYQGWKRWKIIELKVDNGYVKCKMQKAPKEEWIK